MMSSKRKSGLVPLVATVAILAGAGGAYLSGYFYLCKTRTLWRGPPPIAGRPPDQISRVYRYQWQSTLFSPAAQVESWARGIEIMPTYRDVNDFIREEYDRNQMR